METEREVTKSIDKTVRILPLKDTFFNRIIDMTVFFNAMVGKEPTTVFMGWAQRRLLQEELSGLHMAMMPFKGYAGRLFGMNVVFVLDDSRLEVI